MGDELTLPITFTYTEPDIVSAQRLRFRYNRRMRTLGAFGLAAFAVTAAPRIRPELFGAPAGLDWFVPLAVVAVFIAVLLAAYLFLPGIDFRRNPIWRPEYTLRTDEAGLKLARPGATRDFEVPWQYVSKVIENPQVFVLFFGSSEDFLVVPKRAFAGAGQMDAFRSAANSH